MDRTPYLLPFTLNQVPAWRCPVCQVGHLTLAKESLVNKETAESKKDQTHDDWEPDWIRSVFACVFVCSDSGCASPVACSGSGRVDSFEYEDEEFGLAQQSEELYAPMHFNPPLVLMDIPKKCVAAVADQVRESFKLFFLDPGAAVNSLRAAVEALLTDLKVKRFVQTRNGRKSLSLHARIGLLPAKYDSLKDLLLAIKWLGNAGSHSGTEVSTSDMRTTFDLLEHVLSEVYEQKTKKLKAVAKSVNKKKGPVRK